MATICVSAALFCAYKTYDAYNQRTIDVNLMIEDDIEALSFGDPLIGVKTIKKIIDGILYICTIINLTEVCVEAPDSKPLTHKEWVSQGITKTEYRVINGKEIPETLVLFKCEEVENTEIKTQDECSLLGELKWI